MFINTLALYLNKKLKQTLNPIIMKTKKEMKQLKRLKIMKQMESHRPLVVKSLKEQIERLNNNG